VGSKLKRVRVVIKGHKKAFILSLLILVAGSVIYNHGEGNAERLYVGMSLGILGLLSLVFIVLTALRQFNRKGKVTEDERTKTIAGKSAIAAILLSIPPFIFLGVLLLSDPRLRYTMGVLSPIFYTFIPIGIIAVLYTLSYMYYSRRE